MGLAKWNMGAWEKHGNIAALPRVNQDTAPEQQHGEAFGTNDGIASLEQLSHKQSAMQDEEHRGYASASHRLPTTGASL